MKNNTKKETLFQLKRLRLSSNCGGKLVIRSGAKRSFVGCSYCLNCSYRNFGC